MKTKIIYISGAEIFDMRDIRAAFDEVRGTLGLANDTVLFGVPVDSDNALNDINIAQNTVSNSPEIIPTDAPEINETATTPDDDITNPAECGDEIIITPAAVIDESENILDDDIIKPAAPRRGRPRTKKQIAPENDTPIISSDEINPADIATDIATENPAPTADATPGTDEKSDKVIPILSVLASKSTTGNSGPANAPSTPETADTDNGIVADIDITTDLDTPISDDANLSARVTIHDIIDDDTPIVPREKTLEELLESMTPLSEDQNIPAMEYNDDPIIPESDDEADIIISDNSSNSITDDTDATLEQLAAEFAENEDKIPTSPKQSSQGKIGKLKNILPFKKAKRDDTGLMGDLFGWAGIAANDEDFSIPGFFTTAVKK